VAKAVRDNQRKSGKGAEPPRQGRQSGKDQKQPGKQPSRWTRARSAAKQTRTVRDAKRPAGARSERGMGKFLRDVRMEMAKVTWPTRKDLIQSTLVVIVAVVISGAFIGVLDLVFSRLIDLLPFVGK
jgi:preprotein translocase subunit SecE